MTTTAVVLAAGAGTRLGDLGRQCSKAMLAIAGQPLIGWVVDRLRAAEVERIVVVGHASDAALAAWLAARHPGIALAVQHERRGIADAAAGALPLLGDAPAYLACACDSIFTSVDIAAVITAGRAHTGGAVVGILDMGVTATASRSAVRLDGERVVRIVEKPDPAAAPSGLVAAPLYWLPRAVDGLLASTRTHGGERHVSSALGDFIAAGGAVFGVRLSGRIEVTTPADVQRANLLLRPTLPLA